MVRIDSRSGDEPQLRAGLDRAPLLELRDVSRSHSNGTSVVYAVRDVSLVVMGGEFVAIMGASGSGKSSLLNVIGCLDRPSNGAYLFEGLPVLALDRNQLAELRNRRLGFVFQSFGLMARTTAIENVELPALCRSGSRSSEARALAVKRLCELGLAEKMQCFRNQLSGGQQQRVAIARALVNDPGLLLADEPTGNLDFITSLEIILIFQQLNVAGKTIIMVTHDPYVARFCTRKILIRDGRVIEDQPISDRLSARSELRVHGRETEDLFDTEERVEG
jgi:putative ABC transport system ATP-binding protein